MIAPLTTTAGAASRGCPFSGSSLLSPAVEPIPEAVDPARQLTDALQFLELLQREGVVDPAALRRRQTHIRAELQEVGSYHQTFEELEHGSKVAWRNSARCIGRLYWQKLVVRDLRHLETAEEVFQALVEHIEIATGGGKIVPVLSAFAAPAPGSPGIRIWNPQLIRYAGYRQADGTVIGDPANADFTDVVKSLGWKGGPGTRFDLLPLVIQMPGDEPRVFDLPEGCVLEVPIRHPEYPEVEQMGLKWHAVPIISSMRMEIGGVSYTAAPFNGWYMGTEIGARNFSDENRYDVLPEFAKLMGLDNRSSRSLWRDRALVELNLAVLHSFHEDKVTIIDHHTASKHFIRHEEFERQAERPVPGDWSWLVPPVSGSVSPIFHREYFDTPLKPNFFYQANPWAESVPYAAQHSAHNDPELAQRDALTGLLHRGALDTRLPRFARDGGAIALLDLDDLAQINADHGEIVGNAVLRAVARATESVVRPDDECARTGGDEICILLRGVESTADAVMVTERIRNAIDEVRVAGAPAVRVTCCVGLAMIAPGDGPIGSINRATIALNQAKVQGIGQMVVDDLPSRVSDPEPFVHPPLADVDSTSAETIQEAAAARCPWHRMLAKLRGEG